MYFYCYVYVFSLLCMFCSVYSIFIVSTGTLRLPWLKFFCAFSSVVRQMPGYNLPRWGMAHTLPKFLCCSMYCCSVSFCVLLVRKDGFGSLVVSMLASGTQVCGFKPGRSRWIFGRKNPQHAFLGTRSKRICPMSQLCAMSKNLVIYVNYGLLAKFQV